MKLLRPSKPIPRWFITAAAVIAASASFLLWEYTLVNAATTGRPEVVMSPGMSIKATTPVGTITIMANDPLTRSYTWEGATRSVEMYPRTERWYGSLGLYFPGPGDHWKLHNGITRGVLDEGQQHFATTKQALAWLRARTYMPFVYRNDGLVVGWGKVLPRRELDVEVWQLMIGGHKPRRLAGAQDSRISVAFSPQAMPPLVKAVVSGDSSAVTACLQRGADPNVATTAGKPILIVAAEKKDSSIGIALLDKGANPNVAEDDGTTPLLTATNAGDLVLVNALLSKGANVNAAYSMGLTKSITPLILAAMTAHPDIVEALLQNKADVNASDNQGSTALTWAANTGYLEVGKILLDHGADVDSRTWIGITPLMNAARSGNAEFVRLLIAKGANVNAREDEERRQYEAAAFMGASSAMAAMQKSGKLDTLHEDGQSVLDFAKMSGNDEILVLLKQAGAR